MSKKVVKTGALTWIFLGAAIFFFITAIVLGSMIAIQGKKISDLQTQNQIILQQAQTSWETAEKLAQTTTKISEYSELYIQSRESSMEVILDFAQISDELALIDPNSPDFTATDNAYEKLIQDMDDSRDKIKKFIDFIEKNNDVIEPNVNIDLQNIKKEYNTLLSETSKTQRRIKQQINTEKAVYGLPPTP